MNIAIYGKGGIGKSTISSNIAAFLAISGMNVVQIGCDPKHDSTLIHLENGKSIHTVIESIGTNISDSEIIVNGRYGIKCIEIGGPSPGVGCAGRGIITGLQVLEKTPLFQSLKKDCVIYDILGDVVCGGFFEPLKKNKVDEMYIVTSGEFNSLFAANNICSGYINCHLHEKGIKLSGIIGNGRGITDEEHIIKSFCDRVRIPLIAFIPRDNRIEECTIRSVPFVEYYKDTDIYQTFTQLCSFIMNEHTSPNLPTPMSLDELRDMFKKEVYNIG